MIKLRILVAYLVLGMASLCWLPCTTSQALEEETVVATTTTTTTIKSSSLRRYDSSSSSSSSSSSNDISKSDSSDTSQDSSDNHQKEEDTNQNNPALSSCNKATTQTSCFQKHDDATGQACAWCEAGAVPSECVSQEQAALLLSAVFECSTPSIFKFQPHRRHSLSVTARRRASQDRADDFCDGSSVSRSGYMDISGSEYDQNGEDKHLFYWMFEKRHLKPDETAPFILWLTGGPGCSSTMALLTENGPCTVNADGTGTTVNPYSWTETAHVLWLDQPAGVGFSYGAETDTNEQMIAEDVYYFLQAFVQTFSQYQASPLFIVGESYAGHYVPAIAHRIQEGNTAARIQNAGYDHEGDALIDLNLAGLAIGNGLTSPQVQYPYYPEMGVHNSHGITIFDDATYQTMKAVVPKCTGLIQECNAGDGFVNELACQSAFLLCNVGLTSPYQATGLNPYDIRIPCEVPPLCYDQSNIEQWLNLPSTKQALGVDPKHSHSWDTCNFGINMKFHSDWMHDFSKDVAELLDAGYPALIYAGDVDFICNYMGNQAWTFGLDWSGGDKYRAADLHDWNSGQGQARSYGGLTFLQVYDAGHMVPMDQPAVALEMMANFVHGGDF
ncbi:hypothetical protein ACA910_016591 [Epithemia clementina (nom. ined.)]